jgi:hypothetical protein
VTGPATLNDAVSRFGAALKSKLSGKRVSGAPEDQLRARFEDLVPDPAALLLSKAGDVVSVGESTLSALKTSRLRREGAERARPLRGGQGARQAPPYGEAVQSHRFYLE